MEPITILVTALVTGAAAALKPVAEQAIQDAYAGLKGLIKNKHGVSSTDLLESDPKSEARQAVVKEDLEKTEAVSDEEVLRQAQVLLDLIQSRAPETAAEMGVELDDIKGASLKIEDVIAAGGGVKVKKGEFEGDIEIKKVRAGQKGEDSPNA